MYVNAPRAQKVGDKSLTAKEGGLTRTMKSSFSDLCIKYDDIRDVDRMAAVQVRRVFGLALRYRIPFFKPVLRPYDYIHAVSCVPNGRSPLG